MSPILELERVSFDFGGAPVVEDVSLSVGPGDFLGLIGPNGSGKTTLIRLMLGLSIPTTGRVRLFGVPPPAFRQWSRIGYVPQRASIDPGLPVTVEEVVTTGLVASRGILRRPGTVGRARVREVLALLGMTGEAAARVAALSAGQQQRVLIARALVCHPELLVLDEPTGGVDPEAQTSFYTMLERLNREGHVTVVLVSHDIGVVAREVTRLACLNRRLVFHGPPGDFLGGAAVSDLYGPSARVVTHEHP